MKHRAKLNHKQAGTLSEILCILAIACAFSLFLLEEASFFFGLIVFLSIVLCCAGLAVKIMFYRCPHCRQRLPLRTFVTLDYCPRCGKWIND